MAKCIGCGEKIFIGSLCATCRYSEQTKQQQINQAGKTIIRGEKPRKKPYLAYVLSVLIPGAGLGYLGKWKLAGLNFVLAVVVVVLLATLLSDETFNGYQFYIGAAISLLSGWYAYRSAQDMNAA